MTDFPKLVIENPERQNYGIYFTKSEQHGQIWSFDVSEHYQTATYIPGFVNVYNDVSYAYSFHVSASHMSPIVHYEGDTIYLVMNDYVVQVTDYETYQIYTFADQKAGEQWKQEQTYFMTELDVGNRHYFKEKGNLLYTEDGGTGSFYVCDEATNGLFPAVIFWILAVPAGIWMYRKFMKAYRENHQES